ncbi:hypothetical protein G7046_g400 [Stylonectria norvegica]|nr:hypothetical protein G7046_g400 [Stylonectria norvegica]
MERSRRKPASASADKNGGRPSKNFACDHDGCGKRFTRLEHLNRHALNHTAGQATCSRCRAHFKRPDLLARHMDRHREKDEEAGGKGILNTRKRSWKEFDGSVVEKRPSTQDPSEEPSSQASVQADPVVAAEGPISPPASHESSDIYSSHQSSDPYHDLVFNFEQDATAPPTVPSFQSTYNPIADTDGDNFWISPAQPLGRGVPGPVDVPYDEVFQPDTASSFNMPYTTATNYNWLFDLQENLGIDNDNNNNGTNNTEQRVHQASLQGLEAGMDVPTNAQGLTPESHGSFSQPMQSSIHGSLGSSFNGDASAFISHSQVQASPNTSLNQSTSFGHDAALNEFPQLPSSNLPLSFSELERPLATLRRPTSFPCIDECTREEILNLVQSLRPISPEDEPVSREDKLLSLSSLQGYLDLFFTRFNTAYPLIHQSSFVTSNVDSLLLLSMLLLGATYSGKGAHQLAVCIHDVMRPGLFAHPGFSAKPKLWFLQTILLVECFGTLNLTPLLFHGLPSAGKSRAGQKQHDMSHLFHGLLINMIRRSDCQTVQPVGPDEADNTTDDLEVVWHRWAEAEQKKRLALLCFLWDTQHAVLFCQSLCMSSFELRLPLPSSQSIWEAQTASEWKSHSATYTREPQFLTALKSYLTPSSPRPPHLNCLSRVLVLHGLMSVFWDMQRRDETSLGVIPGEAGNGLGTWRDRIARAYDLWKTDFDAQCMAVAMRHQEQSQSGDESAMRQARQEFAVFATSYNAVYHAAQVLLNANFLDLQIYAGARHILGRPVQRGDYVRSERVVKQWAGSDASSLRPLSAAKAAWHAATLLRDASHNLEDFDAMGLFHVPWCLYLATLTCWAFHHARQTRTDEDDGAGEMVWDAKAEMDSLISGMAGSGNPWGVVLGQGRKKTGGLVWVMANVLERVRWGIVHAGVMVLRGLVPWRLINQYETR